MELSILQWLIWDPLYIKGTLRIEYTTHWKATVLEKGTSWEIIISFYILLHVLLKFSKGKEQQVKNNIHNSWPANAEYDTRKTKRSKEAWNTMEFTKSAETAFSVSLAIGVNVSLK